MTDVNLRTVEEPRPRTRALVKQQGDYKGPLFIGKDGGAINYLCGSCAQVLAQAVWEDSIRNIVAECPHCHSLSEFPPDPSPKFTDRVLLLAGTYNFASPVFLGFGRLWEGQSLVGPVTLAADAVATFLAQEGIREPLSKNHVMKLINANGGTARGLDLSGRNLAGIDLSNLDLAGIILKDSNLGPSLERNALKRSILDHVNLTASVLDGARFGGASMKAAVLTSSSAANADFKSADLSGASLLAAKLNRADFRNANLDRTDFAMAQVDGIRIWGASLDTAYFARSLWGRKYQLGDEFESNKQAEEAHRSLKLWHEHAGINTTAGEFRYREFISRRKRWAEMLRASIKNRRPSESLTEAFHLMPLVIAEILFGYGEKWKRTLCWWLATIAIFALVYYLWSILVHPAFVGSTTDKYGLDAFYYSAVSFTALGYGSWAPEPIGWVKYAGLAEAVIGPILVTLFIATFVRIWSR